MMRRAQQGGVGNPQGNNVAARGTGRKGRMVVHAQVAAKPHDRGGGRTHALDCDAFPPRGIRSTGMREIRIAIRARPDAHWCGAS